VHYAIFLYCEHNLNDYLVSVSALGLKSLIYTSSSLIQLVRESVSAEDATLGEYMAAGSHNPFLVSTLPHPVCGASTGESNISFSVTIELDLTFYTMVQMMD